MNEKKLGILGHLKELKRRLLFSAIAVAITTTVSFIFANQIFNILKSPAGNINFVFIDVTEGIGTYMQVCLISGLIFAMPFLIYQLLLFIVPALSKKETKLVVFAVSWILIMFVAGVAFGYFVLIPPAMTFLFNAGNSIATPQIRIGAYISFVAKLLLVIGLVFEMPVVTSFLTRVGVIKPSWLSNKRRPAIIIAFIAAAIITPTMDPINQTLVAAPLIILYEISIWLSKLMQHRRNQSMLKTASIMESGLI
jgi:sec-independent protein translocase protein TatC